MKCNFFVQTDVLYNKVIDYFLHLQSVVFDVVNANCSLLSENCIFLPPFLTHDANRDFFLRMNPIHYIESVIDRGPFVDTPH